MDIKHKSKLRKIQDALERMDLEDLGPDERWIALMEWVNQSRGAGRYLLDLLLDQTSPLSREDREKLNESLEEAKAVLQQAFTEIERVQRVLVVRAMPPPGDPTGDLQEAVTGDLMTTTADVPGEKDGGAEDEGELADEKDSDGGGGGGGNGP